MDQISIEVLNWEKHNHRKDVKRAHWFRMAHDWVESQQFYHFTHSEMIAWIYILSEASRRSTAEVLIDLDRAERICRISSKIMASAIEKLERIQCVRVRVTDTIVGVTGTISTQQDKTGHNKTVRTRAIARVTDTLRPIYSTDFEALWEAYGRVGKKADALRAFEEWGLNKEEVDQLRMAIQNYLADTQKNERTQMYFGTFLRDDWREWIQPKVAPPFSDGYRVMTVEEILGS